MWSVLRLSCIVSNVDKLIRLQNRLCRLPSNSYVALHSLLNVALCTFISPWLLCLSDRTILFFVSNYRTIHKSYFCIPHVCIFFMSIIFFFMSIISIIALPKTLEKGPMNLVFLSSLYRQLNSIGLVSEVLWLPFNLKHTNAF